MILVTQDDTFSLKKWICSLNLVKLISLWLLNFIPNKENYYLKKNSNIELKW